MSTNLYKQKEGKRGEDIAASYLRKLGYQIIGRNFRIRGGEIDIIAIDSSGKEPVLAFIEVKTRTSSEFGTPLDAITPWKLKALMRAAYVYKSKYLHLPEAMRIDAIAVTLNTKAELLDIELVKNIS